MAKDIFDQTLHFENGYLIDLLKDSIYEIKYLNNMDIYL